MIKRNRKGVVTMKFDPHERGWWRLVRLMRDLAQKEVKLMKIVQPALMAAVAVTLLAAGGCSLRGRTDWFGETRAFNLYCLQHDEHNHQLDQCCIDFYKACNVPERGLTIECISWMAAEPNGSSRKVRQGCPTTLHQGAIYTFGPWGVGGPGVPPPSPPSQAQRSPTLGGATDNSGLFTPHGYNSPSCIGHGIGCW